MFQCSELAYQHTQVCSNLSLFIQPLFPEPKPTFGTIIYLQVGDRLPWGVTPLDTVNERLLWGSAR